LDYGALREFIERLVVYKLGDPEDVSEDDVAACAPMTRDISIDETLEAVANGDVRKLSASLARLFSSGAAPVSVAISAGRSFRQLHGLATAARDGGLEKALGAMRPPVFGPRRTILATQCRSWGVDRLEAALALLSELDLALRSSTPAPQAAMVERALIRVALMRRSG
jgi:DNA polymerase-3 subunit delta